MNTQIDLLSNDALDAVSGGRPHLITEGQPANPGSIAADGSPGSVSTGVNPKGSPGWVVIAAGAVIAGVILAT
jgi:hypothetical protein